MKKLNFYVKYDLKWYLEHHLMKNKESTEQFKEIIEILEMILGESKGSKTTSDTVRSVNAVVTIDAKMIQEAIPRLVQFAEGENVQSVEATFLLGMIYRFGIGVPKDGKRAAEFFQTAAKIKHAPALRELGRCYLLEIGLDKDLKQAFECYGLSVQKRWAPAHYSRARCYEYADGVDEDMGLAVYHYSLAAGQGYALAEGDLAICYKKGLGVTKDLKRAEELYHLAASKGCFYAQANLGSCYITGAFGEKDLEKAIDFTKLALAEGQKEAQFDLSYCYANGLGVGLDLKRHIEFCTLSASQQFNDAIYFLGMSYLAGIGVAPDFRRAALLFLALRESKSDGHAKWLTKFFYALHINENFAAECDNSLDVNGIIYDKIKEIDKIEDKYSEFLPFAAFSFQMSCDLKTAEKLYIKAIEYYKKKGDLKAISRLHWDLYFCYQCQKQNEIERDKENELGLEFDAKILEEFYEKIRWSVEEGNYHDLELLAYMNEKSEINSEGNWCAAVQCYHQFLNQLQKEMGEVRDTVVSDKTGLKEEGGWLEALEGLRTGEILNMIDSRNSPEQMIRDRQRKIENAKRKIALFTPLLDLQREIETTGLNKNISALVVAYAMDTDVMQIAPRSNLQFIPLLKLQKEIETTTGLDKSISELVAVYAMDADVQRTINLS